MTIAYGLSCIASLLLVGGFFTIEKRKDGPLLSVAALVFISNLGCLLISLSKTHSSALRANRVAYIGNVFLPLSMILLLLVLCQISVPKKWITYLFIFALLLLLLTFTPGMLNIYYNRISLKTEGGFSILVREYGPLHIIYYFYLIFSFAAMLFIILLTMFRSKTINRMHVLYLFFIVLGNLVIWVMEQFSEKRFEFLSVSYIVSETLILLHIAALNESRKKEIPLFEGINSEENAVFSPKSIDGILGNCEEIHDFTRREKEVLRLLLMNEKRKDIAKQLFVTESTVKKYTAQIFRKLSVSNRMELFVKLKKYQ